MFRALRFVLLVLPLALLSARGQVMYLTGAVAYQSDATGSNVGGAWEYDTFPDTANSKFTFNGIINFALPLHVGLNSFAVSGASSTANPYIGVGLYFSSTATPVTGPFDAPAQLAILDHASTGTTFAFASASAQVSTFGQYSAHSTYSGATTFVAGTYTATVTGFDYDAGSTLGTLHITVVPEPGVAGLLALGGLALAIRTLGVRRRRGIRKR